MTSHTPIAKSWTTANKEIELVKLESGAVGSGWTFESALEHAIANERNQDADRLREINAELLEALKAVVAPYEGDISEAHSPIGIARAAIAKAEGTDR